MFAKFLALCRLLFPPTGRCQTCGDGVPGANECYPCWHERQIGQ